MCQKVCPHLAERCNFFDLAYYLSLQTFLYKLIISSQEKCTMIISIGSYTYIYSNTLHIHHTNKEKKELYNVGKHIEYENRIIARIWRQYSHSSPTRVAKQTTRKDICATLAYSVEYRLLHMMCAGKYKVVIFSEKRIRMPKLHSKTIYSHETQVLLLYVIWPQVSQSSGQKAADFPLSDRDFLFFFFFTSKSRNGKT